MNSSLYNIEVAYLNLVSKLEQNDGLLEEEDGKIFDFTVEEWKNKSEEFCKIIKSLENDVVFCDSEIDRINKVKASKELMIKRFKDSLLEGLKIFGDKDSKKDIWRFTAGTFKLGTTKSTSIEIDEELIDNKWKSITIKDRVSFEELAKISDSLGKTLETTIVVLKTPIKEAIEEGQVIDGARKAEKFNISIK